MANPTLNADVFYNSARDGYASETMTVEGTATKTGILLLICVITAVIGWTQLANGSPMAMPLIIGGAIGSLVLALITCFKPTWSPVTGPLYAALEGLFLGGISAIYNAQFEGIVFQAVCLTFGTLFMLLIAYRSGWIRVTERFRAGVTAAVGAIMLVYIIGFVMSFFGSGIPYIHDSGPIGIGFSLVVVGIAALTLVLDFDFIDRASDAGAPKYMEWYGAFGLLVSLAWLYLEILRLLAKLQSDD